MADEIKPIPKKKPKPEGVAKLKKKADIAFSKYVRFRDGWFDTVTHQWVVQCITCTTVKPIKEMQAGHFVTRGCNHLRYNEQNVNAQCVSCNMFHSGEQYQYSRALEEKYGEGTAENLHSQRMITHKLTIGELEKIIRESNEYVVGAEQTVS